MIASISAPSAATAAVLRWRIVKDASACASSKRPTADAYRTKNHHITLCRTPDGQVRG
ncbi:hypothetical protein ACIQPR_42575 [Streptomyces sp. NPDC091280]|uniref:hypothetical protein n=1 Tax=Streptomyces sp. NPDC091280 TaxID=3365984 RepID=UPI0038000F17